MISYDTCNVWEVCSIDPLRWKQVPGNIFLTMTRPILMIRRFFNLFFVVFYCLPTPTKQGRFLKGWFPLEKICHTSSKYFHPQKGCSLEELFKLSISLLYKTTKSRCEIEDFVELIFGSCVWYFFIAGTTSLIWPHPGRTVGILGRQNLKLQTSRSRCVCIWEIINKYVSNPECAFHAGTDCACYYSFNPFRTPAPFWGQIAWN